jgi:hypothetical protein
MRIVFGHRNFKIREIHPQELGLIDNTDFSIEIRQKYFHLYWIPFFGLGKIWAIRRNGELYELPVEYIHEIKRRNIKVRSPWYTYTLPIMICLGFIIYTGNERIKQNNWHKQDMNFFTEKVQTLHHEIDSPKVNEFFFLNNTANSNSESAMYLKVEKNYTDKILFTLIPGFFLDSSQMELEDCYNQNKANLDTISIPKATLKKAVNNDYELSATGTFKGVTLLNSNNSYALEKIEKSFEPKIDIAKTYIDYKVIQIALANTGSAFTILSLKNITNSIPWNTKLPLEISAGTKNKPTIFILENTENENFSLYANNSYKTEIKIRDSNNIEYTLLINGNGSSNSIVKY